MIRNPRNPENLKPLTEIHGGERYIRLSIREVTDFWKANPVHSKREKRKRRTMLKTFLDKICIPLYDQIEGTIRAAVEPKYLHKLDKYIKKYGNKFLSWVDSDDKVLLKSRVRD